MDPFKEIQDAINSHSEAPTHPYYFFEPWDVEQRNAVILKAMEEDGVDLRGGEWVKHFGPDPHAFQTGYLMSTAKMRIIIGASQVGKSISAKYEIIMMATGEFPIAFRYPKGVISPVKRKITAENIRRWGRRDSTTGALIDFNVDAPSAQGWKEWDCGNIVGVGFYPTEKIAPPGSQIWIGTFSKAKEVYWWPDLAEPGTRILPDHMIDQSMGNNGVQAAKDRIYLSRSVMINMLTYEMTHKRFEAKMAWNVVLDEEPPDREIFTSAMKHAQWLSQVFTPLQGVTWSKRVFFPDTKSKTCDVFHACSYDSPYVDKTKLEHERSLMEKWHRQSRIWGLFAESKGEPFFDRNRLNKWMQTASRDFRFMKFFPSSEYNGWERQSYTPLTKGLLEVPIIAEEADGPNLQDVWTVYEEPIEGVGYIITPDPAEGAETPDEAGDFSACCVMRAPMGKEKRPVLCATIKSTLPVLSFSRVISACMRHYNNAKLAAETKRGWANGVLAEQFRSLPDWLWIKYVSINDQTKAPKECKGFDMNVNTRPVIFELINDYINGCEDDEVGISDEELLKELSAAIIAVKNGKRRCDHPKSGSLDLGVSFGIGLYVIKNFLEQITCNVIAVPEKKTKTWFDRFAAPKTKPSAGIGAVVPITGR